MNGIFDKRNKLNDLTGKEWLKLTKSFWVSEKCKEDKFAFQHPTPFLIKDIEKLVKDYEFDKALNEIFSFIDNCNEYIQGKKPWETGDKKVLYELADSIKAIGILLWPFIPNSSEKIAKQFGFKINWKEIAIPLKISKIKKGEILFKKIEE